MISSSPRKGLEFPKKKAFANLIRTKQLVIMQYKFVVNDLSVADLTVLNLQGKTTELCFIIIVKELLLSPQ